MRWIFIILFVLILISLCHKDPSVTVRPDIEETSHSGRGHADNATGKTRKIQEDAWKSPKEGDGGYVVDSKPKED